MVLGGLASSPLRRSMTTHLQRVDVSDLEATKKALETFVANVKRGRSIRKVEGDVVQLAEVTRMLIDRVQHLEAMVKEMHAGTEIIDD